MKKENPLILRQKAEELLKKKKLKTTGQLSENEMQKLVHELEVHHIELELQNEELVLAKLAEKKTSDKYLDLYDFAPTGYFTLSDEEVILELNLAGTFLLGKERQLLKNKRFSLFISDDSRPVFNQFFEKVFQSGGKESCDIAFSTSNESVLYVHLTGIATEDKKQCLLTAIDITERKQAEQELISSEKKFKNIFNNAVTGKSITYMDGSILVNEAFSEIIGYSEEELQQMKWTDFTHPDDLERDKKIIESIVEGKVKNYRWEKRYIHKNGNIAWVDISTTLQYDENDKPHYFITSVAEITERKLAEKKLQEFKEQFSQFMKHSPVYTYIKEVSETESRVLQASDNFKEMIGIPGPEMIGKTMEELFPPELAVKITADDWDTVSKGKVLQIDEELNNRSYTTIKFPIGMGDKKLLAGYTIDITERKLAENALTESRDLLHSVIENAPIRVFWKDANLRYLGANSAFAQDAGMASPDELIGKDDTQMGWREQAELYRADDKRVLDSGKARIGYEEPQTTPDGGEIVLRTSKVPLRDANRKIIGILGIYDDITERKQAEEALHASEEMMRTSQSVAKICSYSTNLNVNKIEKSEWVCSPEFYNIFGIEETYPHTIEGWANFIHPDYRQEVFDYHESVVKEKKSFNLEYKIIRINDGAERWVHGTGELEFDEKGNPIRMYGAIQDITDQKKTEALLLETNSRHAAMIENIGDVIAIVDVDGIIKYQSPNIEKWFGWKPEELVGISGWDKLHPDDIERVQKEFVLMLESKTAKTVEYRFKCKNGTYKWIQLTAINSTDNPAINGVLLNYHDITDQKKAQETLTKVKNRLKSALDNMSDAVFISDAEGNFIEFNDAFASFHRMKDKKEVAKMLKDWTQIIEVYNLDGSVLHFDRWVVNRAINGETGSGEEYILEKKDTGERWYGNYNYAPIRDDKGMITGSVVVAQDITKRVEAKKALTQSEKRLKTILDSSPFPTAVADTIGENIIYWSNSAKRLFGHNPKTTSEWYELAYPDPDYRQEVIDRWTPFMEIASESAQAVNTGEYRITCKDGSVKICEIFAQFIPDNLIVTLNDITEKKATENKVLKISEHYQALIEKAPDGIVLLNAEGNFKYISPAAKKMFGYLPTDEASGNPAELTHPDDLQMVLSELGKVLEDPDYVPTLEYRFVDKQGQWHWVETTFSNLLANPSVESIVLNFRDITDRKQKEEELIKSEESYRTLLDSVSAGIGYYDLKGNVLLFNKLAASDMNGVPEDFIGKSIFEIFGDDYGAVYFDRIKKAAKASTFLEFEDEVKLPTMSKFFSSRYSNIYNANDDVIGVQIVSYDITELKIVEKELISSKKIAEENEEKFRTVFKETSAVQLLIEPKTGRIIDANQAAVKFYGYSFSELTALNIGSINKLSEDEIKLEMQSAQSRKQNYFEFRHILSDGTIKDVEVYSNPISIDNKTLLISIIHDVSERKLIEKALRESEIRFKALHNATFGGIAIHNQGLILDCNQGLSEITGYNENELTGMDPLQLFAKESRKIVKKNILAGYEEAYEAIGLKKNGEKYPVRIVGKMITYRGQNARVAEFRDITEQKEIEGSLLLANSRNEAILDAVPDIIMEVDVNKVYTWANKEGIEFFGDDVIGKEAAFYFEGEQDTYKTVAPLFKGSKDVIYVESWQRRKDGKKRLLAWQCRTIRDADGNIKGTLSSALDITDRNKVALELKESEERFKLAMNASKDGLYDWNLITNEIYYSPGWKSMLGYEDDELPNDFSVWEKLTPQDDIDKSWEMQQELLNKQRDRFELEFRMKHKDGHWVDVLSRAEAIFDENGNAIRMVGTHVDISEQKNAQENIKKLNEELEEKVIDRTKNLEDKMKELARINKLFVGRELRMRELKEIIKELEEKLEGK